MHVCVLASMVPGATGAAVPGASSIARACMHEFVFFMNITTHYHPLPGPQDTGIRHTCKALHIIHVRPYTLRE